ncbi:hypothetical protein Pmar_PMAR001353 [Perkinsus marinus ATCC 50983]|uniref:Uncharacterized protein n=1 Tax=Perkinsus marinus (strain ATCC 50983 / TXsc) TaxID=423536 RepID=C5KJH0_PERM5|nr:hypothetical protein Pmar_PMAR001353 [Perkinsus marinus ATCC 50983]EER15304.1 hypothetical protein Pmar_PMAR001353 [Perkinsus marinus ATCC 50983]|eukprot:XP_002783508.1 hypothetical protein Pmar_PMAR001353 [Perkinsus marinus ATCC 50983]
MGNAQCCESTPRKLTGDGDALPDSKKPVKCRIQKAGPYSSNYKIFTTEDIEWLEFVKHSAAQRSHAKTDQNAAAAADDKAFTLEGFVDHPGGTRETFGTVEIASPEVKVSDSGWSALIKARVMNKAGSTTAKVEVKCNGNGDKPIDANQLNVKIKCGKDQKHDTLHVTDVGDSDNKAYTLSHRLFSLTCTEFKDGSSSDDFKIDLNTTPDSEAYDGSVIMLAFVVAYIARPTDQLRTAIASATKSSESTTEKPNEPSEPPKEAPVESSEAPEKDAD